MKGIAILGLVTLCGGGAYAQGVVTFNPWYIQTIDAQVYSPDPLNPTVEVQGDTLAQNTFAGNPTAGSVSYGGVPIGGASYTGTSPVSFSDVGASVYTYGNLFTAELYALSTTTSQAIPPGTSLAALSPVSQYQSRFYAGGIGLGPGYFNEAMPTTPDPGIPGTGYIGNISLIGTRNAQRGAAYLGNNAAAAVVAWYNGGGQFATFAAAQAAGVPTGTSSIFEINGLAEPTSVMTQDNNGSPTPPTLAPLLEGNSDGTFTYLQSFSLTVGPNFGTAAAPEPGTLALGVLGACAFLARFRKN
jgi:hypothetical protein